MLFWEGSPTKIDYRKKNKNKKQVGTLILSSLLEDLDHIFWKPRDASKRRPTSHGKPRVEARACLDARPRRDPAPGLKLLADLLGPTARVQSLPHVRERTNRHLVSGGFNHCLTSGNGPKRASLLLGGFGRHFSGESNVW